MFNEWKWSNGSQQYEKSYRTTKQTNKYNNYETDKNAINYCLDDNIDNFNRREDIDEKISEREMLFQCNLNPFLTNNSYVNDIVTRDMYLKPINTTCGERSKNKDVQND